MPSASDELRERMRIRFGDPIDDAGPMRWLEKQGYKMTGGWEWIKPSPEHKPTEDEIEAIQFLIDEWDMGGIIR